MRSKKVIVVLSSLLAGLSLTAFYGLAYGMSPKRSSINNFEVKIKTVPDNSAAKEDIKYVLNIFNRTTNKPVDVAELKLSAYMEENKGHDMPGMGGEQKSEQLVSTFKPTQTEGQFEASVNYTMAGNWNIKIEGNVDNKYIEYSATDSITEASAAKPNWVVIGVFIASIVATGTIFANKRRTKASKEQKKISPTDIPAEDEA